MELIFGTTNPAKLAQIQNAFRPLGITITGLPEPIEVEDFSPSFRRQKKRLFGSRPLANP